MTYQELYLTALENVLAGSGKQDIIDKAVDEFNTPTVEGFSTWFGGVIHVACATCGESFRPESAQLSEEVLCPTHATKPT